MVLIADGGTTSYFLEATGKYLIEKSPATWSEIADKQLAATSARGGDATMVTAVLLADDPTAKLLTEVETLRYGGEVTLDA